MRAEKLVKEAAAMKQCVDILSQFDVVDDGESLLRIFNYLHTVFQGKVRERRVELTKELVELNVKFNDAIRDRNRILKEYETLIAQKEVAEFAEQLEAQPT